MLCLDSSVSWPPLQVKVNGDGQVTDEGGAKGAVKEVGGGGGGCSKTLYCPHCSYATTVPSRMIDHVRAHVGERPFLCPHCTYSTSKKDHLRRHVLTHTGEKPYACNLCSYRSNRKDTLKGHIWTHHSS